MAIRWFGIKSLTGELGFFLSFRLNFWCCKLMSSFVPLYVPVLFDMTT